MTMGLLLQMPMMYYFTYSLLNKYLLNEQSWSNWSFIREEQRLFGGLGIQVPLIFVLIWLIYY